MVEPMGRQIREQVFYLIIPDNFHGLAITRLTEHHTGKSDASLGKTQTCYSDCAQHAFWASQVALMVTNSPGSAGGGSVPGSGRCPGRGYSSPLQYSFLENPMAREGFRLQSLESQRWT